MKKTIEEMEKQNEAMPDGEKKDVAMAIVENIKEADVLQKKYNKMKRGK